MLPLTLGQVEAASGDGVRPGINTYMGGAPRDCNAKGFIVSADIHIQSEAHTSGYEEIV